MKTRAWLLLLNAHCGKSWRRGALVVVAAMLQWTMPARTQALPPEDCLKPGEPLFRMPELISQNGKLRAIPTSFAG